MALCDPICIQYVISHIHFRRLANLFNRTLAVLAVVDTIFIICELLEVLRCFGPVTVDSAVAESVHAKSLLNHKYFSGLPILSPFPVLIQKECTSFSD